MARHGTIYGQMDSVIGRNILNCSFRYNVRLEEILNLHFQSRDIYCHFYSNSDTSILLGPLIELLQCRDGYLSFSTVAAIRLKYLGGGDEFHGERGVRAYISANETHICAQNCHQIWSA